MLIYVAVQYFPGQQAAPWAIASLKQAQTRPAADPSSVGSAAPSEGYDPPRAAWNATAPASIAACYLCRRMCAYVFVRPPPLRERAQYSSDLS